MLGFGLSLPRAAVRRLTNPAAPRTAIRNERGGYVKNDSGGYVVLGA